MQSSNFQFLVTVAASAVTALVSFITVVLTGASGFVLFLNLTVAHVILTVLLEQVVEYLGDDEDD